MAYDNALVAEKLRRWETFLINFHLPQWEEIPDFGLYMEQVIILLKQYLDYLPPELKEEQIITAAAINNYVRQRVMPEPRKKKYYRVHIAYLIMILTLKQNLSIAMIQKLIPPDLSENEAKKAYTAYAEKHKVAATYFTGQIKTLAAPILYPDASSDDAAQKTEDLIAVSALFGGFARLLAEKLLLLDEKAEKAKSEKKEQGTSEETDEKAKAEEKVADVSDNESAENKAKPKKEEKQKKEENQKSPSETNEKDDPA